MVSTRHLVIWGCFLLCLDRTFSDITEQNCTKKFEKGQGNFVLDTDEAVKEGATYIDTPTVRNSDECVAACCRDLNCNLALIKTGAEQQLECFLFDCLYNGKYVCRFVRKDGFVNYILESVYDNYLDGPTTDPG